jgi:glycosyltransferase involved in cell wall biosynthesis
MFIYPPVGHPCCAPLEEKKEEFYLVASRIVPYKRCAAYHWSLFYTSPHRKLVVVGDGPDLHRCKAIAACNVEVSGRGQPLRNVAGVYAKSARISCSPAEEDFGIVPWKAQACGTPVYRLWERGVWWNRSEG